MSISSSSFFFFGWHFPLLCVRCSIFIDHHGILLHMLTITAEFCCYRKICRSQPNVLEIMEFCGHKEFPKTGLQIVFPEALFPFAVICKNEVCHFVPALCWSIFLFAYSWQRFSLIINNCWCTLGSCRWHFLLSNHIRFMPWQCLGLPTLLSLKASPIMYLAPICNLMILLTSTLWLILIKEQHQPWQ